MGQRHQLYIVACINGRYERIVGLHHQHYSGEFVLEGALRFLKACKHLFNVHSIRAELNTVDFSKGLAEGDKTLCPFITALLWGTIAHHSGPSIWTIPTDEPAAADNNDGISVFDITNPCDPRYCFANVGCYGQAAECEMFWPLCAETYVRAYYPDGEEEAGWEEVAPAIKSLEEYKTIPYATLKACWPMDYQLEDVPESVHDEPNGMVEERILLHPLSLYAAMKLEYAEWSHIPEHLFKACSKISSRHFPPTLTQRAMWAVDEGSGGVLDLTNTSIALSDVIEAAKGVPILAQNTLYLDLSTWINPNGGRLNISDLVALRNCFPRLLCLNAIGNGHFDSTLLLEWYESDVSPFSVLWYATRTEGGKSSCFTLSDIYDIKASNALPFGILIPIHERMSTERVTYFGQPYFLPPAVLLRCIRDILTFVRSLSCSPDDVGVQWNMKMMLSRVDDSGVPVMMPAVGRDNPRSPPIGWTLVLDARYSRRSSVPYYSTRCDLRYAFVYCAGVDEGYEVMGVDGFLLSRNVDAIGGDWEAMVSDLRSKLDGTELISKDKVEGYFSWMS